MNTALHQVLDHLGHWNPQLFRELKGRFTPRYMAIALGVSLATQCLMYLCYLGSLPDPLTHNPYNRYCTGLFDEGYSRSTSQCLANGTDWIINWQLWHFDLFIGLTIVGMGLLLIIGSHLITADLTKEEKRGTLAFVRLSPQSVQTIILGKLLGVPSLLYLGIAAALPCHLIMGLKAGVTLPWIGMVDLMAIAACVAVFSLAALWSFIGQELFGGFQAWLYSGAVSLYLFFMTLICFDGVLPGNSPLDWLRLVYPGNVFYYLVAQSSLTQKMIGYFMPHHWFTTEWYGSTAWTTGLWGLGMIFLHYGLLTGVAWQGIERRFYDPQTTVIRKQTGYGIALVATILMTGFAYVGDRSYQIFDNFKTLELLYFLLFLSLSLLLTPSRQRLQDWARFRHQGRFSKQRWTDLLWGERSPAIVAIALSLLMTTGFMAITVLHSIVLTHKAIILGALLLQMGILLLGAMLIQFIFLQRQKRGVWLTVSLGGFTFVPFLLFLIFKERFTTAIALGLFSAFPLLAAEEAVSSMILWSIVAQALTIVGCTWTIHKHIQRLGDSELKTLLPPTAETDQNMLF